MKKIFNIIMLMLLFGVSTAFAQIIDNNGPGNVGNRPDISDATHGNTKIAKNEMVLYRSKGGPKDKKGPMDRPEKKKSNRHSIIIDSPVFLYGIALNPTDSVVYVTDEQMLDSAQIYKKTKFLVSRDDYSSQLKTYMDSKGNLNRTCAVTYALNIKRLDKKYKKQIEYFKKKGYLIQYTVQTDFRFSVVRASEADH